MKSDVRKRTAHNKTGATDTDRRATSVSSDADADYARQLLADAETLLSTDGNESQSATNASVMTEMQATNTQLSPQVNAVNEVMDESVNQGSHEAIAATVILPAQCIMRDAVELKLRLLPQLDAEDSVQIDVSKVERVDAATMQVLLAFVRDRAQRRRHVNWVGVGNAFTEAAQMLGLHSALQLPAGVA